MARSGAEKGNDALHKRSYSKYSKRFEPGSNSLLCSVIVQVRVVLKRTVVGDSD